MRKAPLLAVLLVFGIAGAAYAASIQNVYVLKAKATPAKSGTAAKPVPIGTTLEYTTTTIPKGQRPSVVQTIQFTLQGVQAHTNAFKACSTSRLNDPTQGPNTCPKGSLVGTGHFMAMIGPSTSQAASPACRAEVSLYNGGNNSLSFYVFETKGKAGECPSATPLAFPAVVKEVTIAKVKNLVETVTIPAAVRHPLTGIDVAAIDTVLNVPAHKITVKKKTVGLFESISCAPNHQRQIRAKFTLENGKSQTTTRNVACK